MAKKAKGTRKTGSVTRVQVMTTLDNAIKMLDAVKVAVGKGALKRERTKVRPGIAKILVPSGLAVTGGNLPCKCTKG